MNIQKLKHTKFDENGVALFTIQELASLTIDYVINRRTGERPGYASYREAMRNNLTTRGNLIASNIHRHPNNRIVKNETRVTVKTWIEAHKCFKRYRVNIPKMTRALQLIDLKPDGSSFTHVPSQNEEKSAKSGQSYGPNNTEGKPFKLSELLPKGHILNPGVVEPTDTTFTTAEFSFMDYDKTDQFRKLCNATLKTIGHGKTRGDLDEHIANKCFEDLMMGLAIIGGVK